MLRWRQCVYTKYRCLGWGWHRFHWSIRTGLCSLQNYFNLRSLNYFVFSLSKKNIYIYIRKRKGEIVIYIYIKRMIIFCSKHYAHPVETPFWLAEDRIPSDFTIFTVTGATWWVITLHCRNTWKIMVIPRCP